MDKTHDAIEPELDGDLDEPIEPTDEASERMAQFGPNYINKSQRLEMLIGFISLYSPGQRTNDEGDFDSKQPVDPVVDIDDDDVIAARNLALISAFGAIRRLAEEA